MAIAFLGIVNGKAKHTLMRIVNRKVLFITSSLNLGGAERQLLLLSEKLKLHFEIQLISLESDGPLKEKYLDAFPDMQFLVANKSGIFSKLYELRKFIKKSNPDLVITWLYKADLLGGLAAKIAGNFPVIWSARNSSIPDLSACKKTILCVFSRIIPNRIVSNGAPAYDFHKLLGYPESKLIIIQNMLAPWISNTLSKSRILKEKATADKLRIGIAARQVSGKGILEVIKIISNLTHDIPPIELTLIGQSSIESRKWEEDDLYGNHKAKPIDNDSELAEWFASLDLYVMSSTSWESQPNSLIEAVGIGCPVLISNHIQLDLPLQFVQQFDPTSQHSFEKSLRSLLALGPSLLKEQTHVNQLLILDSLSSERALESWLNVINQVQIEGQHE